MIMKLTPSIVLVQTQLPENIGAAARAMMNFGLSDLRLVAPRDGWPNSRAYDLAGHAASVLDTVRVFDSVRDAVADCRRVYAATARAREMVKPVFAPAEAMQIMAQQEQSNVAILFGPERTGLANDDVAIADTIITIPTSPSLASLNVGQSVVVLAYEWCKVSGDRLQVTATTSQEASAIGGKSPAATKQELQGFLDRLEQGLDEVDFWKVDEKKPKMWLNLQNIFTRANLTEQEVRTLHGVVAELKRSARGE
jgi:tRNA/rRNA methyltransferase